MKRFPLINLWTARRCYLPCNNLGQMRAAIQTVMSNKRTIYRLKVLNGHYVNSSGNITLSRCKSNDRVTIGDVSIGLRESSNSHKVPKSYLPGDVSHSLLTHLKWMMQKDLLGQDIFLIGSPGPMRRRLALMYLEMTNREHEYIALSRDTTEADLKQRREIKEGTAYYVDQCAVRAATEGRVLVLEGIEKAERNVLPVLNNLLENREMQLEDGRFLMRSSTYDKLLNSHSQEEMDKWKIVRVSEEFRVIALGLPIPRYSGNPLDPPLRSRFQARDISNVPFKEQYEVLRGTYPALDQSLLSEMLSFAHTLTQEEVQSIGLADFPLTNMPLLAALMNDFHSVRGEEAIRKLYPYNLFLSDDGRKSVVSALEKFDLGAGASPPLLKAVTESGEDSLATVTLTDDHSFEVRRGGQQLQKSDSHYVSTEHQERLLADLLTSHRYHDICIVGPRGCGKSTVVRKLSSLLGYHVEPILLYQDMTSRDLLQQRTTLENGDTAWRPSPLLDAMQYGHIAVLDGLHRINGGTFSVLASLIQDRELNLADGSRLLRHDRFDELTESMGKTTSQMEQLGVRRIHPSFRIIALAEPPDLSSSTGQWLNAEILSMFIFHHMTTLPIKDEVKVIDSLTANHVTDKLFELSEALRRNRDPTFQALATTLSTRNLLRIARRLSKYPDESLHAAIHSACMSRFLPTLAKRSLEQTLESLDIIESAEQGQLERSSSCSVKDGLLRIGNTECVVNKTENVMKVPDTLFYDNPMHISVMESMLKDYLCGEHLLLVGNQGVGKNKVVDRFLQLLGRPREYIQLHRDTTVQTLTLQPTVREGKIVYDDSPLVKAVREGLVLVIDEADKAPTNVTCVLKTLVESGQMHLSDGRKIISDEADAAFRQSENVIRMHPDFRMIVLANRPGFPFLGNDFFHAVGDIFSCLALDNPDIESEVSMLRQYGKDVPEDTLRKLVLAFGELRSLADQGVIAYPYSTREVVSIVKHLQLFPDDGLATVVSNVFDFDQYNSEMKETIIETMHKHGIPLGALASNVSLAKEYPLPGFSKLSQWTMNKLAKTNSTTSLVSVEHKRLKVKGPVQAMVKIHPVNRKSARSTHFTELESSWQLPTFHESSHICDVTSSAGADNKQDMLHFVGVSPAVLYSMKSDDLNVSCLDLYEAFPTNRHRYQPSIRISSLGSMLPNTVLLHEQVANILLLIDTENGRFSRLECGGLVDNVTDALARKFGARPKKPTYRMCSDLVNQGAQATVALYELGSYGLTSVDVLEGTCHQIDLPVQVTSVRMPSPNHWMVENNNKRQFMLEKKGDEYSLSEMSAGDNSLPSIAGTSTTPLHKTTIQAVTGQSMEVPNRLLASNDSYADVAVGYPELQDIDVYSSPREEGTKTSTVPTDSHIAVLSNTAQVVRSLPGHQLPKLLFDDGFMNDRNVSGYLEITDVLRQKLRFLKVAGSAPSPYSMWMTVASGPIISALSNDGLVSVDSAGGVQLWETSQAMLDSALQGWTKMIGKTADDLQMTYERDGVKDCQAPKHGKVDPTGNPHVGGNTWAGGTGGRDTAGLGGVGGPYRLDAGHDVHQVSQEVKDQVPEHIREAAREMGQKAFRERLKQIQMSEFDAQVYDTFYSNVKRHIQSMRVVLDSLQAKGKERQWLKNQTQGDLDDGRIIEGLTGERTIYRRRGEKEPEPGSPQTKPKRLRLLVDVSGSMYRFNGHDYRLQREMEVVCMVLEAFQGYEQKLKYDVYGHSGEDYAINLSSAEDPPKNNKQRLQVLQTMHAHSQFCLSGDFTLKATRTAIEEISKEEADEHFVIVLSDANLDRYGISAESFANALTSKDNVNAYAIFIGSLGDQADRLVKQLPSGHSFACLDTARLPQIIQQIFTSTFLK